MQTAFVEAVGWASAVILLSTLGRQVYVQWRDRRSEGVSRWLFTGQVTASLGFVAYSLLTENWVFVVTNALILVTAVVGQTIFWRNRQREERGRGANLTKDRVEPA